MNNQNITIKQFILPVILGLLIIGGVFYWQKNKNTVSKPQKTENASNDTIKKEPIVLGNESDSIEITKEKNTSNVTKYTNKIKEVRNDVNDIYEDIIEKVKYPNLFSQEEILELADKAESLINNAKNQINQLDISYDLKSINEDHKESLNLLLEGLQSLRKAYDTNEKKYLEEFYYKIEQSNKILNEMQISQ